MFCEREVNGQLLPTQVQIESVHLFIDEVPQGMCVSPETCASIVERFFEPAYQFDRWIRYQEWSKAGRPLTISEVEEYISELPPKEAELFRANPLWLRTKEQRICESRQ